MGAAASARKAKAKQYATNVGKRQVEAKRKSGGTEGKAFSGVLVAAAAAALQKQAERQQPTEEDTAATTIQTQERGRQACPPHLIPVCRDSSLISAHRLLRAGPKAGAHAGEKRRRPHDPDPGTREPPGLSTCPSPSPPLRTVLTACLPPLSRSSPNQSPPGAVVCGGWSCTREAWCCGPQPSSNP